MSSEPPPTHFYSLDRSRWDRRLDIFLVLYILGQIVSGVFRLREDVTSWWGWLSLSFAILLIPFIAYLWHRGYCRTDSHLRLHDTGLAFVTRDMAEPIRIPLENLQRIRWVAGNLRLEMMDGDDHQLMTSFLPYDRIQEMKTEIREWGLGAGIEVLG